MPNLFGWATDIQLNNRLSQCYIQVSSAWITCNFLESKLNLILLSWVKVFLLIAVFECPLGWLLPQLMLMLVLMGQEPCLTHAIINVVNLILNFILVVYSIEHCTDDGVSSFYSFNRNCIPHMLGWLKLCNYLLYKHSCTCAYIQSPFYLKEGWKLFSLIINNCKPLIDM